MKLDDRYMQAVADEIVFKNVDALKVPWDFIYYVSTFLLWWELLYDRVH